MGQRDIQIEPPHDPAKAIYWGAFVIEPKLERDAEVLKLYQTNDDKGEFFYVFEGRSGRKVEQGPLTAESTRQTEPIQGFKATLLEKRGDVEQWLEATLGRLREEIKWLKE